MKLIFFRRVLRSILLGALVTAILLLTLALVLSKQSDPSEYSVLFSWIALCVGAFLTGKFSTLGCDEKLLTALVTASGYSLTYLALSVFFTDFSPFFLLKLALTAVLTFTGAMIGKNSTRAASSKRRRKTVIKQYSR